MRHGPSKVRVFTLIFGLARRDVRLLDPGLDLGLLAARRRRQGDRVVGAVHDSRIRGHGAHRRTRDGVRDVRLRGIPRLTMTVGYDPRFSGGHFGVWVVDRCRIDAEDAMNILKKHGAEEVRRER